VSSLKPKQRPGKKQVEFWSLVDVKTENECWPWLGHVNQWGYGRYRYNDFTWMAHRLSYEINTGENTKGFIAMHTCDNPRCCNPKHLVLGTHADNQHDKYHKDRQARGENNGSSLLTNEQVLEARSRYKPKVVTYKMLAEDYGVCQDTMQKAIRRIYWKHL
jgi:hypothetical protein